jgi:transcriptional regulator with XRE-family HTH domain
MNKNKITRAVAMILNDARIEKGMTFDDIGDELEITKQAARKYLLGKCSMSIPTFYKMCAALEVTPDRTFQLVTKEITK